MGSEKSGRRDGGCTTLAAIAREAVAEVEGPFVEVGLHEKRTGRMAKHRAETRYDALLAEDEPHPDEFIHADELPAEPAVLR